MDATVAPLQRSDPVTVEGIILSMFKATTAAAAAARLFKMLCMPPFLREWANMLMHTNPEGLFGNGDVYTCANYVRRIMEVFLRTDLYLEIECSALDSNSWKVYPFGTAYRYIHFPLVMVQKEPIIIGCIQRLMFTSQAYHVTAKHSATGGAFGSLKKIQDRNMLVYSDFAYNNMLDMYFPRMQFVAAYLTVAVSQMRVADVQNGVDVDAALRASEEPGVIDEKWKEAARSQSVALRLLVRTALECIQTDHTICTQQRDLHNQTVTRTGKERKISSYIQVVDEHLRRIDFASPYIQRTLDLCKPVVGPDAALTFTPKTMLAHWEEIQADVADRVAKLYPLKFTRTS